MNLVDAYRRRGSAPLRTPMATHGSVMRVTYELLESMLELPNGVHVRSFTHNPERMTLDVVLMSDREIEGVTFPVVQGAVLQAVSMDDYTRRDVPPPPRYVGYPFDDRNEIAIEVPRPSRVRVRNVPPTPDSDGDIAIEASPVIYESPTPPQEPRTESAFHRLFFGGR